MLCARGVSVASRGTEIDNFPYSKGHTKTTSQKFLRVIFSENRNKIRGIMFNFRQHKYLAKTP